MISIFSYGPPLLFISFASFVGVPYVSTTVFKVRVSMVWTRAWDLPFNVINCQIWTKQGWKIDKNYENLWKWTKFCKSGRNVLKVDDKLRRCWKFELYFTFCHSLKKYAIVSILNLKTLIKILEQRLWSKLCIVSACQVSEWSHKNRGLNIRLKFEKWPSWEIARLKFTHTIELRISVNLLCVLTLVRIIIF